MSATAERIHEEAEAAMRRTALEKVVIAYDRALTDPAVRIPTYMHAALEACRRELKQPA